MTHAYQKDSADWTIIDYSQMSEVRGDACRIVKCLKCQRNGLQVNKHGVVHLEKSYRDPRTLKLHKQRLLYCQHGYEPPQTKQSEQTVMPWGKP